jgi:hypothetical protein
VIGHYVSRQAYLMFQKKKKKRKKEEGENKINQDEIKAQ